MLSGAESTLNVGVYFSIFPNFLAITESGGVLCNKIWCSHKIRVVTKSELSQNTVYSIVPTQADKMRARLYNLNNFAVPFLSRAAVTCVGTALVTIYVVVQNGVSGDKNTDLNKFRFNNNLCDSKRQ